MAPTETNNNSFAAAFADFAAGMDPEIIEAAAAGTTTQPRAQAQPPPLQDHRLSMAISLIVSC